MTEQEATIVVEMLTAMAFFPTAGGAQALIGEELKAMCGGFTQAVWLARRMAQLYAKWPGVREMRAAYCSKFGPLDRIECGSEIFLDGIPSEAESRGLIAGPQMKALAAGGPVSADPVLDQLVVDLAMGMQPELRSPEELGAEAKAAHPELAGMEDKIIGLKLLAKARRDAKRVDRELRAMFHVEEERRA